VLVRVRQEIQEVPRGVAVAVQPAAFPYPAHPLTPYAPAIVNVALTGMVAQRDRVPHVPVTAEQIADDAEACCRAGATVLHVHARDADGRPDWRRAAYAELVPELRRRCPGVVVCVTTSGRDVAEVARRADVLALEGDATPDMASLTLGSLNFHSGPSVNAIATVEALARRMRDRGIRPELEVFDLGMAHLAHRLRRDGLAPAPAYANLMLGFHNGAAADARTLVALVDALPAGAVWAAAGLGAYQQPANALALAIGGHVRTGLEDNPHLDHVTRAPATNPGLVARAVEQAAAVGRAVATPVQTRALLGLAPPAGETAPVVAESAMVVESVSGGSAPTVA
jgi:3-keto-5-aminohexanoate cleavage enzyme